MQCNAGLDVYTNAKTAFTRGEDSEVNVNSKLSMRN